MTTEAKKDEPLFLDTPEPKVTDEGGLDIVLETKPAEKKEPEPKVEDKKEPEVKKDEKSEPKADDKPVFDDPKRQTMFEEGYIDKDGKPGPNHDKFVKLYGEKKDLERQLRDGIDNSPAIQEVKSMLQNLIERNKVLEEQIADSGAESRLGRLDVQLAELESQQATAKDDMDMDKFSSLNDKIVEVKMALRDEEAALKQGDEPAAPANAVAIDAEWATAVVEASTAPHGYDWTVYPGGASGSLPAKAYLGCWYRGRAVLSGNPNDPHQWYMSRQLNPFDFAYVANDAQTPVAGTNADAGKVGDIVRALIPFHDDYMIFGCASSMHYLQGDPAAGGELYSIDDFSGIFGAQSWCFDKTGDLYLFGDDGISRIKRGTIFVENLSVVTLPKLLENEAADPTTHRIVLGYDKRRDGIVIAITKLSDGSNSNYFYDIKGDGFFPETYPDECGPYSMLYYSANSETNADLLFGCKDGYIRSFDDTAKDDDIGGSDQTISSHVLMPIQDLSSEDDDGQGRLSSITLELSGGASGGDHSDSDGATLDVHVRDSAEKLVEAVKDGDTPLIRRAFSGTGRQKRIRKKARGKWLGIVLKNSTVSESWSLSKLSVITKIAGRIKG